MEAIGGYNYSRSLSHFELSEQKRTVHTLFTFESRRMNRVVSIDHLSIHVSDFKKSKAFYGKLFDFLGFKVLDEYDNAIGWTNGKTRFWISTADTKGKKRKYRIGDVGYHHYAFELRNRKDVDELYTFVQKLGAVVVDPPDEYYEDYYAVFFLDPDGLKLEGMKYGKVKKSKRKSKKNSM